MLNGTTQVQRMQDASNFALYWCHFIDFLTFLLIKNGIDSE